MYVANWKMNVSPEQAGAFYHDNYEQLYELTDNATIVLCPSFVSLGLLSPFVRNTELHLGAQNCSEYATGAFTGEVNALSLEQIGCSHCIVGHSERRSLFGETDAIIAHKITQLLEQQIIPIICVGETLQEHQQNQTLAALEKQLALIPNLYKHTSLPLVIAYEPIWAIGSGVTPSSQQIAEAISGIKTFIARQLPQTSISYIYGGSVNAQSIKNLKTLSELDGFLIGGASSDFQTFKNIVV